MAEPVLFFFSFRSPYCWIAFRELPRRLAASVQIAHYPIFPPPDDDGEQTSPPFETPQRISYYVEDMNRITRKYGLKYRHPDHMDCEWSLVHAAYLFADEIGCGQQFGEEAFSERFQRGANLGERATIEAIARKTVPVPEALVRAATSDRYRSKLAENLKKFRDCGGFGVPLMIYRNERFWGQDRIEDLVLMTSSSRQGRDA